MKSNRSKVVRLCGFLVLAAFALQVIPSSAGVSGARYLRFWVFKTRSANSKSWEYKNFIDGNVIGDFRIRQGDVELNWPVGTVCKYDNIQQRVGSGYQELESTTKVLDKQDGTTPKDQNGKFTKLPYVHYTPRQQMYYTICLPEGQSVDFDEYAVFRGYDTRQMYQSPQDWRMEVSADGENWYPIDEVRNYDGEDWHCYGWYGVTPTNYYRSALNCDLAFSSDGKATLTSGSMMCGRIDNSISAQKLRWTVFAVMSGSLFHVREFNVALGGVRLARATGAVSSGSCEGVENLFDGNTTTGWEAQCDFAQNASLVAEIDLGEIKTFDGYDICVAGDENVTSNATPVAWTLEAQDPETEQWHIVATENAASVTNTMCLAAKCTWRSDHWHTDLNLRGSMFHLKTDGLPAGLTRTAGNLKGALVSTVAGTTAVFSNVKVDLSQGSDLAGKICLTNAVLTGVPGNTFSTAELSGSGRISFAAGADAVFPALSQFSRLTLSGDNGVLTPAKSFALEPYRDFGYMRYRVFKTSWIESSATAGRTPATGLSEFEILDENGDKVFWPSGTTAYRSYNSSAANQLINGIYKFPNEGSNKLDDRIPNRVAGGMSTLNNVHTDNCPSAELSKTCAFLSMQNAEDFSSGPSFVIKLADCVDFTTYRLFATYNCIGYCECPMKFSVDISFDGENWHTVDSNEYTKNNPWPSAINLDHLLFYKKSIDWNSVLPPETDRIADDCTLELKSTVVMTLDHARETVGGLCGAGKVVLTDEMSELVVSGAKGTSSFSGTIEGEGTLTVDGGRLRLGGADLSALAKIVVRNGGALHGKAKLGKSTSIEVEDGCRVRLNEGLSIIIR